MKLIGITPSSIDGKHVLNRAYTAAFTRPNVCPVILSQFAIANRETITQGEYNHENATHINELVDRLDGLVLSGGPDVSPALFGKPNYASKNCDSERDMMEVALLTAFLREGKPIMGICKGFQLIAHHFGLGHFQQEITVTGEGHAAGGEHYEFKHRQEPLHGVNVYGDFVEFLRATTGRADLDSLMVNSLHHQGISVHPHGKLGKFPGQAEMTQEEYDQAFTTWRAAQIARYEETYDVSILAATPMVIEAYERPASKVFCTQFHSEEAGPKGLTVGYWIDKYLDPVD